MGYFDDIPARDRQRVGIDGESKGEEMRAAWQDFAERVAPAILRDFGMKARQRCEPDANLGFCRPNYAWSIGGSLWITERGELMLSSFGEDERMQRTWRKVRPEALLELVGLGKHCVVEDPKGAEQGIVAHLKRYLC